MNNTIERIKDTIKLNINIPKTLYFNFKVFGFRNAIKFPVFLYGKIELEGLYRGCIEIQHPRMGGVKIGGGWYTELFGYSNRFKSYLRIKGKLLCGNNITINQGAVISISENAVIKLGDNVRFSERVTLHSKNCIEISKDCLVGWNTQIIDTDFHYIIDNGKLKYRTKSVFLGQNVWLANGVSIMKGTRLPSNSVVASNSLVNKDFTETGECCLYGGVPAKCLKNNVERLLFNDKSVDKLFYHSGDLLDWDDVKDKLTKENN